MKQKMIEELDIVRGLAILAVLIVHSSAYGVVDLQPGSNSFLLLSSTNTFFRIGTTTFIMLSSFVLFYSYFHRPLDRGLIKTFYFRRMKFILIPYVIFTVFYYWLRYRYVWDTFTIGELTSGIFKSILLGDAHAHLYFVFISIQFFIMFPLLILLFKKYPAITKHLIWIGFLIQIGYYLLNFYYINYPGIGTISLTYFSHYLMGAYIGIHYTTIRDWFKSSDQAIRKKRTSLLIGLIALFIIGAGGHVLLYYIQYVHQIFIDTRIYQLFWIIHTFFAGVLLILLAHWLAKYSHTISIKVIKQIGMYSFGIYIFHPIVLYLYNRYVYFGSDISQYMMWIFFCFLASLVISYIIVYIALNYVKFGWALFGSKPRKKQRNVA